MPQLIVNTKSNNFQDALFPPTQQSETGASYVDVTNSSITVLDGEYVCIRVDASRTGSGFGTIGLSLDGVIEEEIVFNSPTILTKYFIPVKNKSGGSVIAKLRMKGDGTASMVVEALKGYVAKSKFVNITDLDIRVSLDTIEFYNFVSSDVGIFGTNSNGSDLVKSSVDINSIIKNFIWSSNTGRVLFDYSGKTYEVI